ncbi:MAG TPA: response regulator [Burkholderiaceae bacterium]|nr:response regulator [Burkholderiaceae bacterium]
MARALVIDDNPVNLELARFLLAADAFEVALAADAEQAWALLRGGAPPDVVLVDIQLPDVDGLQVVRALRADARLGGVCVIAFTAYAMLGDELRFIQAGCDGYLSKPIDVDTFAASVRTVMARCAADR